MYAYDGENPVEAFVRHGRELTRTPPTLNVKHTGPNSPPIPEFVGTNALVVARVAHQPIISK